VNAPVEAPLLRLAGHDYTLEPGRPLVMGVVNTNPGSFSDRRYLATLEEQVDHALALAAAGATIIDVGTDSGVTYDDGIALDLQITRACALVGRLVGQDFAVSVDTAFPEVAEATLALGADLVNDVSGLADPAMARLCADHGAGLVIMHTRARHKQQAYLRYPSVVDDVVAFLTERLAIARAAGLEDDQVLFDPGIGYAKLPEDDVAVLRAYPQLAALGRPILTGASRKYFAGVITGAAPPDRLPETLATVQAVRAYPGVVRVHDVAEVRRFLDVLAVVDGISQFPDYDLDDERLKWVAPGEQASSIG